MTQRLEKAMSEVHKLSTEEPDAIAALILDELADDRQRDNAFAQSQDKLAKLASKVRDEIKAGRVRKMAIDEL